MLKACSVLVLMLMACTVLYLFVRLGTQLLLACWCMTRWFTASLLSIAQ